MKYVDIDKRLQLQVLEQVRNNTGLDQQTIEKDWWVTQVLRALFSLPYAEYLSFKGGTSLGKCWKIIERFSEDVDIAIDRKFLGFEGELSKRQISDRLRRATCSFVREKMQYDVRKQIHRRKFIGLSGFNYDTLYPATLNLLPPNKEIERQWREDYKHMQDTMIYGESVSFDVLLDSLKALNARIRELRS
ncbi:MAG: nucleotidyl transferase AbiEii/AbiGii toxin family protein [Odoribacter sp.]|nr:nucleotidyl transferase AbiEii/AbiGii toxin family protein [Odoribacter sp.]